MNTIDTLCPSQKGAFYEKVALNYLKEQKLVFKASNIRYKSGEIDIVMEDGEYLVFVEVRYRKSKGHGHGIETISPHKKQRLIKAAKLYLLEKDLYDKQACRFDLVGINHQQEIIWIKNAIEVEY